MSTFRAAMDVTADAIYLVDRASMRFIDVNEAACRMQGRSRDELLALGPAGVLLISREELERTYNSIVTGGAATKPQEILRQGKDGSQVWIELRSSARRSGERWTIVTVARDITERKRTEERVRKLSHAVEQSPAATVITDTEGRFEYVNRKFLEVTGYAWEELIGRTPTVTKSGLTPVEVYQGLWRTILAGGEWRGEMQNRKKNGDLYWEYEVISPLKNERGEIVNFIAIKEDITERKEAEENLRASELRFRQMEENIRDVFFLLDADGTRMLYASPAYEDIWGRTRESLYANSESWTEAIHPEDMASVRENYKQGMSVGKAEDEFRIVRPDGSIRWVELRAFPVRDDAGKIVRIAGVAKDITERKRTEAALQEELVKHQETARELFDARVWLAETDRQEAVGRLAAGVAHEVKNPLAIIRLGVDYLSKEFARESNEAAVLDKVQQAVIRADTVITDLLQFSRKKSLARHPTQINAVIDNAINLTRHEITLHNIEIVRSYDDSMPPILADPDQLAQVFVNLLSNAAHAIGQGGRIEVVARSRCLSERDLERDATRTFRLGERVITAEIRDSGPGISPENEKRLFEPFFTTKPIGEGTGLGLAVSRNIVIMHEGSINLSNRPEGGASAFLMFPAAIEGSANEAAHTGGG